MEKWNDIIDLFILSRKAQGLAPRTIGDYKEHIDRFFNRTHPESFGDLKLCVMRYFADSDGISAYTFNTRRKKLITFFMWMVEELLIKESPMVGIKHRKEDHKPKPATEDAVTRLLKLPDKKTFCGIRDYAIFILTLDTGIRPSEALDLKVEYIDLRSLLVNVPAEISKTREARTMPITAQTAEAIRRLMLIRPKEWNGPLFCSQDGSRMTKRGWEHRLEYYSRLLGVKVTPYQLRHSFGTFYLRQGGTTFALQKMLGHQTGEMTRRYVEILKSDVAREHAAASPVVKLLPAKNRIRKV
jgi:integrase